MTTISFLLGFLLAIFLTMFLVIVPVWESRRNLYYRWRSLRGKHHLTLVALKEIERLVSPPGGETKTMK